MQEVTDFGFNVQEGEIDGYVECECGKEIHFVIKKEKIQSLLDVWKKQRGEGDGSGGTGSF